MSYIINQVNGLNEEKFLELYETNKETIEQNTGHSSFENFRSKFFEVNNTTVEAVDSETGEVVGYGTGMVHDHNWLLIALITKTTQIFMQLSGRPMHTFMIANGINSISTMCIKDSPMYDVAINAGGHPDLYLPQEPIELQNNFFNIRQIVLDV